MRKFVPNKKHEEDRSSYWTYLLDDDSSTAIKPLFPCRTSSKRTADTNQMDWVFPQHVYEKLTKLSREYNIPMNVIIEAAWGLVLQKYNYTDDVMFGIIIDDPHLNSVMIPVRMRCNRDDVLFDLLQQLKEQEAESRKYAHCDILTRKINHLIKTVCIIKDRTDKGKQFIHFPLEDQLSHYSPDLLLHFSFDCNQLNVMIRFDESNYTKSEINNILTMLTFALCAYAEGSERKVRDISFVSDEDRDKILTQFQTKPTQYPHEESIKSLFEAQVKKTPDRIAVSCGTEQLTYAELNAKANIVANRLLATKAESETGKGETMVALLLERNIDMVIGILGVVKAGYVYVPIDPEAPQDRIQYTLADSGASLLLVNQGKEHMISLPQGNIYAIEHLHSDEPDAALGAELTANPDVSIAPQDALYIIYTSGTTGEPKGTIIEHECVVRLMQNDDMPFHFHEEDVWSLFAAYNFDVSVWEMYGALLNGGHLVVIPNDAKKDSYAFLDILREKRVTVLNQVPSSFYNLMQVELAEAGERLCVKHLIFAGEALQVGKLKAWHAKYPDMNIVNMYGITETTVHVTYKAITAEDIALDVNDIGKALPTLKIYILDGDKLCGIGVPGELCVAGVGVARGYLNKPELTSKKFVANPFVSGERMYRSGDLAKWLPDGNIAYLGRIDDQVKIRGFRIELGEVEYALRQLAGIQDAAVIVRETHDGENALFAYLISKDQVQLQAVRRDLEEVLPAYMVPAYMMQIDQLPVTRNGKLDKRALPEIVVVSEKEYTAPKNELEAQLCDIFSEVLGVERVGTQDSFFELGGDSIKAIRIVSKLRSAGYYVASKDIMQKYTVEAISYTAQKSALEEQYEQDEVSGIVPLTPIVREFASWNLPKPHHFNQDMLMEIDLEDEKQLREVLDALIAHHDILRSVYREGQLEIVKVSDSKAYELKVYDFSEEQAAAELMEAVCTELHSSIDLEEGPLVKAAMFRTGEGNLLFLGIHHLVVDGVSWRILQEDISTASRQVKEGTKIQLPAKTASYNAWAEALTEYKSSHLLQKERVYWERVAMQMATGELRMDDHTGESGYDNYTIHLSVEETESLLQRAGKAFRTEVPDLLISALGMTVKKLTGASVVTIGVEGHGREAIHKRIDIDRTIGWFTSVYPIMVACHDEIAESIIATKEMLRKIPNHGFGYGLLYDILTGNQLPTLLFNYMGQMDAEAKGKKIHFLSSSKGLADENKMLSELFINGVISEGKLSFTFRYNRGLFSNGTIQRFAAVYKACIQSTITYCMQLEESVPTPSDYQAADLTRADLSVIQHIAGGAFQIDRIYGLTSLQKGMLYHSIVDTESTAYRNQNIFIGQGYADEHMVKQALKLLVMRHEVLRTAIIHKNISIPKQVVIRGREVEYERTDLTGAEPTVQAKQVEAIAHDQIQRGFDLEQDPLLRVHHVVLARDRYQLIWNFHHILLDGWSLPIVYGDFNRLYKALEKGALTSTLETQVITEKQYQESYEDYIIWLEKQDQQKGLSYWSDVLAGYEEVAEIKPIHTPQESEQQVQSLAITLSPEDALQLRELIAAHQLTVSNVVETAWGVVLQAYSGQKDVVFGKVMSGRQADVRGIEGIVGLFINTIPVRVASKEGMSILELIKEMQQQGTESEQYAYCSLAEIQAQTEQKQNLIQVLYMFENYYVDEDKLTDFMYEIEYGLDQTNYNLTLCAYEHEGKIVCEIIYNPNVYAREDIAQIVVRLEHVIQVIVANPEGKLSELETITEEEQEQILGSFNDTGLPYAKDKTIPALWEEQVVNTPDAIALVYEDNYMTYDALNKKINQVAWALRRLNIKPDDRVVIVAERSVEMIAGMYGIIKAGAAYVPVDPTFPAERIQFILADCKPKAVLVYKATIETGLPTINLADDMLWEGMSDNPEQINRPNDLAYIIYTSGTTGQPKGVMLEHCGVVSLRHHLLKQYNVTSQDNVLQFANYVFDASVWEMTLSLLLGATLTLVSKSIIADVTRFNSFMQESRITLAVLPPQYYLQTAFTGVRWLTTAGAATNESVIEQTRNSDSRYCNAYGPTECTVQATYWEYDGISNVPSNIPIGKPIANNHVYVLDGDKLCGIGVPGELCVAGVGVARGYLNKPELTSKKFVANPFVPGERMYRSGDLAKWLPDGNIAYLGRIDDQVKIRGFRIEPGEVENALRQLAGIQDAAVIVRETHDGEKALSAYLVSKDRVQLQAVRQDLEEILPAYMVPAYMMQIDRLPVTRNGKLDKRALPEIVAVSEREYTAPKNELEEQLCSILSEVLGVERVGMKDSFFELGGDSIKAIRIISKLRSMGYHIAIKDIMQRNTVGAISYAVQKSVIEEQYEQDEVSGIVPLTPIVREFASWNLSNPHHFNQDMLMEIDLEDEKQLREVLDALVVHHDMLRSIYREGQLEIVKVSDSRAYELKVYDYSEEQEAAGLMDAACTDLHSSIDLEEGPLVKAAMFRTVEGNLLFLGIHHIVVDGVSWRILQEDISTAIRQVKEGTKIRFPAKTASYKAWAEALAEYKCSHLLQKERAYWERVATQMESGELSMDEQTGESGYGNYTVHLNEEETTQLIHQAGRAYNTEINDLLISALGMTVKKLTGARDVTIGMEGHGREPIHKRIDIDRTVGWFTSVYPVVVSCHDEIAKSIITTKEILRKIPNRGLGYGLLQEELPVRPLDVMFNYMGQMDAEAKGKKLHFFSSGKGVADENKMLSELFINGVISERRLTFTFRYNRGLFSSSTIQRFAEIYKACTQSMIAHCMQQEESVRTPSDYSAISITDEDLSVLHRLYPEKNDIQDIFDLLPLQEGILYHDLKSSSSEYFTQFIYQVNQHINTNFMRSAFQCLLKKHDVLRTAMVYEGLKHPKQIILSHRSLDWEEIDLTAYDEKEQLARLNEMIEMDVKRGFDLQLNALFRIKNIKLSTNCTQLIWSFHHIIADGWCTELLCNDLKNYYNLLQDGYSIHDVEQVIEQEKCQVATYGDYIQWFQNQDEELALTYWCERLRDYDLTYKYRPYFEPPYSRSNLAQVKKKLDVELTGSLLLLAQAHEITINTITEAAWGIVLQQINFTNDIVFGKVISGRHAEVRGIESIVGLFINTIPVRVSADENTTIIALLQELQDQGIESTMHAHCSLVKIQEQTAQKSDLISSLFVFENHLAQEQQSEHIDGLQLALVSSRDETNYPLNLLAAVEDEALRFTVLYNPNKHALEEVEMMLSMLNNVLCAFAEYPEKKIFDVELVRKEDKARILGEFNNTASTYPKHKSIPDLFEEQVQLTPDQICVVYGKEQLSYQQLDKAAQGIATELRNRGVSSGQLIGIVCEKSVHMIVGLLGILKAGCGYVPINTDEPDNRLRFILEDCDLNIVLCGDVKGDMINVLQEYCTVIDLNGSYAAMTERALVTADDIAYVMYTSGTTGYPKGVCVTHQNVVRLVKQTNYADLNGAHILLTGALSFDASTFEIWGALLNGGKLVLAHMQSITDGNMLGMLIYEHQITMMWMTAQLFNYMVDTRCEVFQPLQYLLVGGERLSAKHIKAVREKHPKLRVINGYGPTENTTFSVTYAIETDYFNIPIGKPISNSTAYILDRKMQLCGIGVPGELVVGGDGVAKGYMNQPKLTVEKFIENPLIPDERLYRTGDIAMWLPDGDIAYIGRIDDQVKIRGYRIEVGEVEHALRRLEGIQDAIVIAREQDRSEKELYAYLVSSTEIQMHKVRNSLGETLPAYMVPQHMIQIEKVPMTRNGKVDKRALSEIQIVHEQQYTAAATELEFILCNIFGDVLSVERVGIYDDFFALGGHSLHAVRVINQIEAMIGIRLPIITLFENPHIKALSQHLERISAGHATQNTLYTKAVFEPIPHAIQKETYRMSSAQKRLYAIQEMDQHSTAYNMTLLRRMDADLDSERLQLALKQLIQRHESLRTSFHMENGEAIQRIHDHVPFTLLITEEEDDDTGFVRAFDLSQAPLIRVKVVNQKEGGYLLALDMHHIISDGTSINNLMQDLSKLYNGEPLETMPIQYKDYSEWLQTQDITEHETYWLNSLQGEIPVLDLPTDFTRPQVQQYTGKAVVSHVELREAVTALCRISGATEYMVLLSTWMVLLSKYSRQEDIIVGCPVNGRLHYDTEPLIGMFVNTIALRGRPAGKKNFVDFLSEMKEVCLKGIEHQAYPLEDLVDMMGLHRDMSRNPLFDVLFVFQNNEEADFDFYGINSMNVHDEYSLQHSSAKFDLTLEVTPTASGYRIEVRYATSLYQEESVRRMVKHYETLLAASTQSPKLEICQLPMMTQAERQHILTAFNDTSCVYDETTPIHEQFEQIVQAMPDKTALRFRDQALTYAQLNMRANQLARILLLHGTRRGDFVGILFGRSIEMMVGILATLKVGAAYVPIDPTYPLERIQYMVEDSGLSTVLTQRQYDDTIELPSHVRRIHVDQEKCDESSHNLHTIVDATDIAYIIYTSGSTGKPKGVMVEHRSISNLIAGLDQLQNLDSTKTMLCVSNISFDGTVYETLFPLLKGMQIVIADEEAQHDPKLLLQLVEQYDVNIMKGTPTRMKMLMDEVRDVHPLHCLEVIVVGGEPLTDDLATALLENWGIRLFNVYGPTEATVDATGIEIHLHDKITIGKPIANVQVFILDSYGSPLPIGVAGELCISGAGVARGYHNRTDLTAEKFVDNPFLQGERMYCTGDLARWLPDGNIEYIGRIDDQVKVRGYRIELGEIEHVLRKQPDVLNAVVMVREDAAGDDYLCAYVVPNDQVTLDTEAIREDIRQDLPDYMIPAYIVPLVQFPITSNGKLDRRSLPEPDRKGSGNKYVAPRDQTESVLVNIFREVLGVERISTKDSFFELGGDSIKAIRIVSKMRSAGYLISVPDILSQYTVEKIAYRVGRESEIQYDQGEVTGQVMNTPIIHDFGARNYSNPNYHNQDAFLTVRTDNETHIHKALQAIAVHHDMLRAIYRDGSLTILSSTDSKLYELQVFEVQADLNGSAWIESASSTIHQSMDINKGPLMKAALFKTESANYLFLCIHHLVIDAVSWQILLEDLETALQQLKDGKEIKLPSKTLAFKDWAESLEEYKSTNEISTQANYWNTIIAAMQEEKLLIDDDPHDHGYEDVTITFRKDETEQLIRQAGKAFGTEINDLLISAIGVATHALTKQSKVSVCLEGHGREAIHKKVDIDRTIGWFTVKFPIRVSCHDDLRKSIIDTKEMLRKVPLRGLGFGLLQGNYLAIESDIYFNYLGQLDTESNATLFTNNKSIANSNGTEGAIDMNGYIVQNMLHFIIRYDRSKYNRKTVERFAALYKEKLSDIITYCCVQDKPVKTASDYSCDDLTSDELVLIQEFIADKEDIDDIYTLTPMQEGILYHYLLNRQSTSYVTQMVYHYNGNQSEHTFEVALKLLTKRHDVLRTAIVYDHGAKSRQLLLRSREIDYAVVDWSGKDRAEQASLTSTWIDSDLQRGFDLQQEALLRVTNIMLSRTEGKLIWSSHHIISDGWSDNIIFNDFIQICEKLQQGLSVVELEQGLEEEKEKSLHFKDFVNWLEKQDEERSLQYWRELLLDYEESADIKPLRQPEETSSEMKRINHKLPVDVTRQLLNTAATYNITLNTMIETALGIVLQELCGIKDVVFGKVVSGRNADVRGIEHIAGIFVNTIPIRICCDDGMHICDIWRKTQEQAILSDQHGHCSFAKVQRLTKQNTDLVKVLFTFDNNDTWDEVRQSETSAFRFTVKDGREQTNYTTTFKAYLDISQLHIDVLYDPRKLAAEDMVNIMSKIQSVLLSCAANPEMKLSELETTTEEEKEQILGAFQTKPTQYPHEESIKSLFEAQVKKTPDRIAVSCGTEQLTYAELNAKANIVANRLLASNGGCDTDGGGTDRNEKMVALLLERNIDMVIGILGVVKAGYVYVPIDPEAPQDRIQYTLVDSGASLLLVNQGKEHMISLPQGGIYAIEHLYADIPGISDEPDAALGTELTANPDVSIAPQDALYIIYTSGTTGEPKGTIIEHECVVRLMKNDDMPFDFHEEDVWSLFAAYNFDVSVWEMYGALLYGGHLVVIPNDAKKDSYAFLDILREKRVTVLNQVPSSFYNLMQVELAEAGERLCVKHLIFAGEALQVGKLKAWHAKYPEMNIVNMYGITETTVHVTYKAITAEDIARDVNDVGKALPTLKIYILDGDKLCGIGVPGELCVAGVGVARGYLNKPELTSKKFVANPFVPGERMYRSGDLAKWLPDGNIAYLGRIDDQVKIRGFRIELGEVENALRQLAGIQDAAVIVRETHDGE
ncbi:non-ribosomal peptide synthetase, partial [Paenibacillus apiarius]|uniref:non-ribosomal peptide synthetase n=1 Tax=Paenibacillus apiarius TaxID=46240 RepID=UPI002DB930B4